MSVMSIGLTGCNWNWKFWERDARPIEPVKARTVDQAPLASDADRRTTFRREGVLEQSDTAKTASRQSPVSARPAPVTTPPVVVMPAEPNSADAISAQPVVVTAGAVVANVNGEPIFAHEVIKVASPVLQTQAGQLNPTQFRKLATEELTRARDMLVADRLVFAAAERNSTPDDIQRAETLTMLYRDRLVSAAGGSEAVARQKMRAEGEDFDANLRAEYRRTLTRIYYFQTIMPRAQVSVEEMRRYYEQHKDKTFTQKASASFRIIEVSIRDMGDEKLARQRVDEARQRAVNGEDWTALSDEFNKDPMLKNKQGLIGPVSREAYYSAAIEDAVWAVPIGRFTEVIREKDKFVIATPVDRKEARTQAFEEASVQEQITVALRELRIGELRRKENEALRADAIIDDTNQRLQPAIEIAMQLYPTWRVPRAPFVNPE
jgi:parvulin-like peptidyl-prolyl isomerase